MLIVVLLLDHAIFYAVVMLSRYRIPTHATVLPWMITALVVIHAILSIAMAVLGHKGAEKRKCNTYAKLNARTMLQRFSGILMMVMIGVHIAGAATHFQPKMLHAVLLPVFFAMVLIGVHIAGVATHFQPKMLHAVLHPVFFAMVLLHLAVSMSKAFITLGIGNAKLVKVIDVIMMVVCSITFIGAVVGFYLCLFLGVVR